MACTYDVPMLKDIFTKILRDGMQYCSLCFHTSDERRLVTPHYFKKYLQATNINEDMNNISVCFICEHKSKNALKVLQDAKFCSSVKQIVAELVKRKQSDKNVIFQKKYFAGLVKAANVSPKTLTPIKIQEELKSMRSITTLTSSDIEIADNSLVYHCADSVFGMSCRKNDPIKPVKMTFQNYPTLAPKPLVAPFKMIASNGNSVNECSTQKPIHSNSIKPSISGVKSTNLYLLTKLYSPTDHVVIPKVITMRDLTSELIDSSMNFMLHAVYKSTNDKFVVPSLSAEIICNNIYFYDSSREIIATQPLEFNADLLQVNPAHSVGNELKFLNVSQAPAQNIDSRPTNITSDSSQNYITIDSTQNNKAVVLEHSTMLVLSKEPQNKAATFDGKIISCQSQNTDSNKTNTRAVSENLNKRTKNQPAMLRNILTNNEKKGVQTGVSEVIITDISSDMDEPASGGLKRGTDWEDKIPMDVISFVDAVDPNADKTFVKKIKYSVPYSTIQIEEPRSLANYENEIGIQGEIIDLC